MRCFCEWLVSMSRFAWTLELDAACGNKWTAWDSPGRFLIEDLRGECAHYPDWGTERHLKVRVGSDSLAKDWARRHQLADTRFERSKSFELLGGACQPSSDAISAVSDAGGVRRAEVF